jgi:hypothetical protein
MAGIGAAKGLGSWPRTTLIGYCRPQSREARQPGRGSHQMWHNQIGEHAAALIDWPVHQCRIVTIRGNSCRMRQHRDLSLRIRHRGRQLAAPTASRRKAATN